MSEKIVAFPRFALSVFGLVGMKRRVIKVSGPAGSSWIIPHINIEKLLDLGENNDDTEELSIFFFSSSWLGLYSVSW